MTLPKCMLCSNFNENSEEMTCKAFPDGIPEDVIFSGYEEADAKPELNLKSLNSCHQSK